MGGAPEDISHLNIVKPEKTSVQKLQERKDEILELNTRRNEIEKEIADIV